MTATVSLVEDDKPARDIFGSWITESGDFKLLSQFDRMETAVEKLPEQPPNIVLTDINLPGISGVEGVRRLKPLMPNTHFVMLTVYEDVDHIFEALSSGAIGYLLKHTPRGELLRALREVHDGGSPMSTKIARKVVQAFHKERPVPRETEVELAPREKELVHLLASGYLYKEIADQMGISVGTVNTYIRRVYEKLHVHSRSQAIAKLGERTKPTSSFFSKK